MMNSARLSWAAATDSDGIACYYVYEDKNGTATRVTTFQSPATEGTVYLPFPPSGVASETHHLYLVAVDSRGAVGPRSGTVAVTIYNDIVTPPSSPPPTGNCDVDYRSWSWSGGMSSDIAITNTGSTPISGWRLTFTFPSPGQHVTSGWSANWAQLGTSVTATTPSYEKGIAPGQTRYIGFLGTNTGTNPAPAGFYLNGALCS
ncbi:cellulose binding domain-containing protein [Sphaerisporangium sp. NPDC088356]|uniref:cellulose binding domain-containing protein n=1 Tax=Sphaerisporangium sp. NPDC088356 TaxID=3154871 RepID=UPI00342C3698